jgi:hypothetical protein
MSNIINRGTWDIRRHNYISASLSRTGCRTHIRHVLNCEFCQSTFGFSLSNY